MAYDRRRSRLRFLKEYIVKRRGLSMQEFAKIVGIPHTYLSQMIGGRKNISPEMAEKIEKASNGDIPRMMLLYPHEYFPEDEIKEDGDEKNEE